MNILQRAAFAACLAVMSAQVAADTCEAPDPDGEYKLVFSDEFNGSSLDRARWNTQFLWGPGVIINNETQYYVNEGQFDYDPFIMGEGVLAIQAIKTPFDRHQLYLTRSAYSANAAEILWRVPEGAVLYEVYRDGEFQGTSTGGSYYQDNLRDGIDYGYEVVAKDADGNVIVRGQITINTGDRYIPVPAKPFGLHIESNVYSDTSAEISWEPPSRAGRFTVHRNGELYRKLSGRGTRSLYESDLEPGKRYDYLISAIDRCNKYIIREQISVNTADGLTPQDSVERLIIKSAVYSKSSAEVSWNAVQNAVSYDIHDNGEFVVNTDGRSLFVEDLVAGVDRKFKVTALDASGNTVDETTRVVNSADNSFALNRQPFLSGIITSYDSFRFKYGRVEARARMPKGKGLWGAFWLLNAYYNQDQPEDPEIDIMEAIGSLPTTAHHAYHYKEDRDGDGNFHDVVSIEETAEISDFSTDFHVYRVDWEPELIVWYVDDVETARVEGPQVSDEQMYIIANLAVGGWFPGPADETTPFPAKYELDYIRVYQR